MLKLVHCWKLLLGRWSMSCSSTFSGIKARGSKRCCFITLYGYRVLVFAFFFLVSPSLFVYHFWKVGIAFLEHAFFCRADRSTWFPTILILFCNHIIEIFKTTLHVPSLEVENTCLLCKCLEIQCFSIGFILKHQQVLIQQPCWRNRSPKN